MIKKVTLKRGVRKSNQICKTMKKNALEYTKFILEKVSFDPSLFRKEYYKAIGKLVEEDVTELREWVRSRFRQEIISIIA